MLAVTLFSSCSQAYYYPSSSNLYPVNIDADSCGALPIRYSYLYFYYKAVISGSITTTGGCTADSVRISDFFIDGTCIQQYNSNKQGCSNANDTQASDNRQSCEVAFSSTSRYQTLSSVSGGKTFDSSTVCANAYQGYFYIENNCPSGGAQFTVRFDYTPYGNSCSSSSWPTWASITIAVVAGLFAVGLLGCVCMRMRRRRAQPPPQVQMGVPYNAQAPPYPPQGPPPNYYGGGGYGAPAAGYPAQPAGAYAHPPPAGYPPAGYPKV